MSLTEHINEQARAVNRDPSEAQKRAGNYRKGHVRVHGLDISIENPRGSFRSGIADGKRWRSRLPHHYGYIRKTEGGDGDHVDVFIGPHLAAPKVFVIDQINLKSGAFDEHKCFVGFASPDQARAAYCKAFSDGRGEERIANLKSMTVDQFKAWLKTDTTRPIRRAAGGGVYDTRLGPADEMAYGAWKKLHAPNDSGEDYDLRGAYLSGEVQAPDGHMTDRFKKPNHPTFSDQSQYATGDERHRAGHWEGDTFVPPAAMRAAGGRVHADVDDYLGHYAAGGAVDGPPAFDATEAAPAPDEPPPFEATQPPPAPKSFSDRVSNAWEKATPGGPLWMVREAARGIRGSVEGSAAARAPQTGTEEDEYLRRTAAEQGPGAAMQASQFLSPAAPKGSGGIFGRALREAESIVAPIVGARKDAAGEFGINLSKGQSTQDLDLIRYEDMAARGAYGKEAQDRAAAFFQKQHEDAVAAGQSVGQQTARAAPVVDNPAEAAGLVSAEVTERALLARGMQARAEEAAALEAAAQRGIVADQGRAVDDAVRGGAPPIQNPREAGEIVGQNVRDAAATNRADFRARYDEFGNLPGEFRVDAVRGMGTRVRSALDVANNPIIIDDQLTPAASRAIQALDQMSIPRIQNRASLHAEPDPTEIAGVSLRGIDQMRKKLVAYYQTAERGSTDARAVQGIIHEFDGQIERAITEGLFSGDPRALTALQEARASYSRYRQTFGPRGAGDDVGTAMRRIVDRNATPEEVANMVIGSGKIGSSGTPVRLADRLEQVLGADSEAWSAIRQAMWQKASQVRNTAGEVDPVRSANSINEFVGSTLGQRMFSPQERAAMRAHAQGTRDIERVIEQLPQTQTANRVREVYQDAFGGADLGGAPGAAFRRMVEGTATPEEVANGVFKVIGSGNPGNAARTIRAIERVVGPESETMSAVRQGVWQKLTQAAEGKDQPGAQKAMQSINEFLNGSGKTIAEQLYSPKELALMQRYADAVKLTIIPKYARTNSDTAPAMFAAIRKYGAMVAGALGLAHGEGSGLAGLGVGKMLEWGASKLEGVSQAKRLNDSLENLAPGIPRRLGARERGPDALRRGATSAPSAMPGLSGVQGPVRSYADDEKPKSKGVGH